ncbi:O-antigen polymerase [Blastococcus sp. SYSU DS0533]
MIVPLLAVAASAVVWCGVYRRLVGHPLDPVALTLYYVALLLLWRPFTIAAGLDTPFPTEVFAGRDVGGLVVGAQAAVVVWLLAMLVGARWMTPLVRPATLLFPRQRSSLAPHVVLALAVALSIAALAATAVLWARYGGPTGLIQVSKVDRSIAESRALRALPLMGALASVAAFWTVPRRAYGRRLVALGLVALNGYVNFTWGARDVQVVSLVALVAGSLLFGRRMRGRATDTRGLGWVRDPLWRRRLLLVAATALGAAFLLRLARDTALWGAAAPSIEGQGPLRAFAVATNNTLYDTLLLILDDWPDRQPFQGGRDFVDAAVAAIPSALAGAQEPFVSPAVRVAQTYVERNNGFPATAVGDWYLNLGWVGIVLGGLLSGILARAAQVALHRFREDPLVWGFSLVFMLRIFPGGVWVTSLPRWVAIGLPLVALAFALDLLRRRPARVPGPAPGAADRPGPGGTPTGRSPVPAPP